MARPPDIEIAWPLIAAASGQAKPEHFLRDFLGRDEAALVIVAGKLGPAFSAGRPVLAAIFAAASASNGVSV